MIRLKAAHQTYEWGKLGNESKVATMLSAEDKSITIDPKSPYAELWMGTHPKGRSLIASTGQPLSAWLADHVNYAGENLKRTIDVNKKQLDLPFLFKVLSVNKALSIQVHPNKDEAALLHKKDPKNYPDPNHKPEMAIALTPFELLCSFRPLEEIMQNLDATPELVALVGNDCVEQLRQAAGADVPENKRKEALKICFSNLMTQSEQRVAAEMDNLLKRTSAINGSIGSVKAELLHRLNKHFPRDVGCWAPFFLNHFWLQPGEAVFLGANEAHAYLSGDCIECMACSDNTVRAGLTPKFRDVQNLCRMLTYRTVSPKEIKLTPKQDTSKYLTIYDPPVKEFCVHRIEVPRKENYVLHALNTCSIVLVVEGCADVAEADIQELTTGFIGLLPAKMPLKIIVKTAPLVMFQSFAKD